MPPVADDRGERLLKLEESVSEIRTSTALTAQKVDHLVEKIDAGFTAVKEQLTAGAKRFEKIEEKNDTQEKAIAKLEEHEVARSSRWAMARKAAVPLLAAAAGVIAHAGGGWIWQFIAALFGGH